MLPPDGHVHSEWSWDAGRGSMEQTCARAVELGLSSVAFTEHAEFAPASRPGGLPRPGFQGAITPDGQLMAPVLHVEGYLESVQRCREKFPGLRLLSGVELSEPHWHGSQVAKLLDQGGFDRVLASVHSLQTDGTDHRDTGELYVYRPPADVVRAYLAEAGRMIAESDDFAVLAHIDYPVRYWPGGPQGFDPAPLEEEFRAVLRALASTSRALEINTRITLDPRIVGWWHDCGGDAITFGSDAHYPGGVARNFAVAADMARAQGFRPGRDPHDLWRRG
ncbi:MAG: PHP domain-containing protein [Actinomycetota bacterium]